MAEKEPTRYDQAYDQPQDNITNKQGAMFNQSSLTGKPYSSGHSDVNSANKNDSNGYIQNMTTKSKLILPTALWILIIVACLCFLTLLASLNRTLGTIDTLIEIEQNSAESDGSIKKYSHHQHLLPLSERLESSFDKDIGNDNNNKNDGDKTGDGDKFHHKSSWLSFPSWTSLEPIKKESKHIEYDDPIKMIAGDMMHILGQNSADFVPVGGSIVISSESSGEHDKSGESTIESMFNQLFNQPIKESINNPSDKQQLEVQDSESPLIRANIDKVDIHINTKEETDDVPYNKYQDNERLREQQEIDSLAKYFLDNLMGHRTQQDSHQSENFMPPFINNGPTPFQPNHFGLFGPRPIKTPPMMQAPSGQHFQHGLLHHIDRHGQQAHPGQVVGSHKPSSMLPLSQALNTPPMLFVNGQLDEIPDLVQQQSPPQPSAQVLFSSDGPGGVLPPMFGRPHEEPNVQRFVIDMADEPSVRNPPPFVIDLPPHDAHHLTSSQGNLKHEQSNMNNDNDLSQSLVKGLMQALNDGPNGINNNHQMFNFNGPDEPIESIVFINDHPQMKGDIMKQVRPVLEEPKAHKLLTNSMSGKNNDQDQDHNQVSELFNLFFGPPPNSKLVVAQPKIVEPLVEPPKIKTNEQAKMNNEKEEQTNDTNTKSQKINSLPEVEKSVVDQGPWLIPLPIGKEPTVKPQNEIKGAEELEPDFDFLKTMFALPQSGNNQPPQRVGAPPSNGGGSGAQAPKETMQCECHKTGGSNSTSPANRPPGSVSGPPSGGSPPGGGSPSGGGGGNSGGGSPGGPPSSGGGGSGGGGGGPSSSGGGPPSQSQGGARPGGGGGGPSSSGGGPPSQSQGGARPGGAGGGGGPSSSASSSNSPPGPISPVGYVVAGGPSSPNAFAMMPPPQSPMYTAGQQSGSSAPRPVPGGGIAGPPGNFARPGTLLSALNNSTLGFIPRLLNRLNTTNIPCDGNSSTPLRLPSPSQIAPLVQQMTNLFQMPARNTPSTSGNRPQASQSPNSNSSSSPSPPQGAGSNSTSSSSNRATS